METTDPPQALTLIMEMNGWSQRRLGRELGGQSQQWVSSVLLGRRDPGIKRFAAYLGHVGWEVVIRPKREDRVKRREFHENIVKVAGGALTGKAASALTGPKALDSPYRDPGYVLGLAQRASDMREELGGGSIAQKVWEQARGVDAVISQGGREIRAATSEFSRQAAWVFSNAGRADLAETQARKALFLSMKAADNERQAAAHAVLSDIFLVEKNSPDRAAFHAQEGLRLPGVSEGVRASLKVYLAGAIAQDARAAASISRARQLIDQARDAGHLSSLDSGWIQHRSGLVLHNLGEYQQAFGSFEQSVRSAEAQQEAHALADAARVALDIRDLDHAGQLMGALSYVVPLVSSTRVDRKAVSVVRESARWANVREIAHARGVLTTAMSKPSGTA